MCALANRVRPCDDNNGLASREAVSPATLAASELNITSSVGAAILSTVGQEFVHEVEYHGMSSLRDDGCQPLIS